MDDRESRQRSQIVAALGAASLDRVRLMKALFLFWYRSGKPESGPFHFRPYLYGPCAFDLYTALDAMERDGLIAQAPHANERWGNYHLTNAGETTPTEHQISNEEERKIAEIASWVQSRGFRALLREVYNEAPDFAGESVFQR